MSGPLPPTSYMLARDNRSVWQIGALWVMAVSLVVASCGAGAVFGWVKYFSDDGFAPQFEDAHQRNLVLHNAIGTEAVARAAADSTLTEEQAVTGAAIDAEIATRTAEDAQLLALITAEIAARVAAQQMLNASLAAEIAARLAADALAFSQLANLTARIDLLTAYNVYAQQQFVLKFAAFASLDAALAAETAARIAADNVLAAQDTAQQAFIVAFSAQLAAEIAARTAEDVAQLTAVEAILGPGILYINNKSAVNHNIDFLSDNAGFTIGSGGTNVVTITNHAILTVDGQSPDPTTFDVFILADTNVQLVTGPSSLQFSLVNIPPVPNYYAYTGTWVNPVSNECHPPVAEWFFDAYNLRDAGNVCSIGLFIVDYNTPTSTAWQIPLNGGGVPDGVWLVHTTMVLTMGYLGTPYGISLTMGVCIDTRINCLTSPQTNTPQASLNWQWADVFATDDFRGQGMNLQDHIFKSSYVVDGRGAAVGTGVFPVWIRDQGEDGFGTPISTDSFLRGITVQQEITQLA